MWTWLFAGMLVFGAAAVIWLGHPLWPDLELFMLQRDTVQNLLFVSLMLFLTAFMVMFWHVWHSNKRTRIQAS